LTAPKLNFGDLHPMRQLLTYDFMETMRVTNQWLGSTARAMCSYPQFGLVANPAIQMTALGVR